MCVIGTGTYHSPGRRSSYPDPAARLALTPSYEQMGRDAALCWSVDTAPLSYYSFDGSIEGVRFTPVKAERCQGPAAAAAAAASMPAPACAPLHPHVMDARMAGAAAAAASDELSGSAQASAAVPPLSQGADDLLRLAVCVPPHPHKPCCRLVAALRGVLALEAAVFPAGALTLHLLDCRQNVYKTAILWVCVVALL